MVLLHIFLSDVRGNTLSNFTFYLLHDFLPPYLNRVWPYFSLARQFPYVILTLDIISTIHCFPLSNFTREHLKDVERHSKTLDEVEPGPTELTSVACLVVRVNRSFHLFLCIYSIDAWGGDEARLETWRAPSCTLSTRRRKLRLRKRSGFKRSAIFPCKCVIQAVGVEMLSKKSENEFNGHGNGGGEWGGRGNGAPSSYAHTTWPTEGRTDGRTAHALAFTGTRL